MVSVAKPALVFMLVLATAMVVHGGVMCKNECPVPIIVNGINITVGVEVEIELLVNVTLNLVLEVLDTAGELVTGSYYCPSDVTSVACVQVESGIEIVVTGLSALLSGLLGTVVGLLDQVLGLVLGTLSVTVWMKCNDDRFVWKYPTSPWTSIPFHKFKSLYLRWKSLPIRNFKCSWNIC